MFLRTTSIGGPEKTLEAKGRKCTGKCDNMCSRRPFDIWPWLSKYGELWHVGVVVKMKPPGLGPFGLVMGSTYQGKPFWVPIQNCFGIPFWGIGEFTTLAK